MALNVVNSVEFGYGIGDALIQLAPRPILAKRAPTIYDVGVIGTVWIDEAGNASYTLTSITSGQAQWTASASSGIGTFTSVTVNPGNLAMQGGNITSTTGSVTLNTGDLTLTAGNATIGGDLSVAGTFTFTGDLNLNSPNLVDIVSTLNGAPSILLEANGGANEQVKLSSLQGTSLTSIELISATGGIYAEATGLVNDAAIYLNAAAGGMLLASAGLMKLASSRAGNAIDIEATHGVTIQSTGAAAGEDINITSTGASINLSATEDVADAITLIATHGGIQIEATGATAGEDIVIDATGSSVTIGASEAAVDAITLTASDAAGGIILSAGTGGIDIGSDATITSITVADVVPTASRTLDFGNGLFVNTGVNETINIGTGGMTASGNKQILKTINIGTGTTDADSDAAATAEMEINIGTGDVTDDAVGLATLAIKIGTGTVTNGLQNIYIGTVNSALVIEGQTDINYNTNANTAINTGTSTGNVDIGNAAAGPVGITTGGTFGATCTGLMTLTSTAAAANAIKLDASDAAGGVELITGGGAISFQSAGMLNSQAVTATDATGPGATAAVTINSNVGVATLTGFTQAAAATLVLTVTNSIATVGSAILCSCSNLGTNDAQMTITRITPAAGSFAVTLTNNGAAALNGDVIVTFWVVVA